MLGKIGHPTGERVIDLVHILNVGANKWFLKHFQIKIPRINAYFIMTLYHFILLCNNLLQKGSEK